MRNYVLATLAVMELPVATVAVRPAPGRTTQTIVRLPNQYGVSVHQQHGVMNMAVICWDSDSDPIDRWEFVDQDVEQSRAVTVDGLVEELRALQMIPDLSGRVS